MTHILCEALGEEFVIAQDHIVAEQVVKSAGRVFQILEMFDTLRREALVSEMASLLGLPQSSTSVLLRSMVAMGYVTYNRDTRAYYPTTKVALLGSWINAPLVSDGTLIRLMQRINERTGQAVILSARNRISADYIHVIQAKSHARLFMVKGLRRALTKSACGLALMSPLPDAEIKRIAMRINSEVTVGEPVLPLSDVLRRVEQVRNDGYVRYQEPGASNISVIAMALPPSWWGDSFVIGLGGSNELLQDQEADFIEILREEIAEYQAMTPACAETLKPARYS